MKLRHILTLSLLVMAAVSAAVIASLLIKYYTGEELKTLCSSLQVVIFIFTASAGLLALIKYWNSVEADLEHKQWEKLHHLQDSFDQFRDRNLSVIQAFEWSHILRSKYLPLCDKALQYDKVDDDIQTSLLTLDELTSP